MSKTANKWIAVFWAVLAIFFLVLAITSFKLYSDARSVAENIYLYEKGIKLGSEPEGPSLNLAGAFKDLGLTSVAGFGLTALAAVATCLSLREGSSA